MSRKKDSYEFALSVLVNEFGETESVLFLIRDGSTAETVTVRDGVAYADYDNKGRLISVELLGPCKATVLSEIARSEPPTQRRQVSKFLRQNVPQSMVTA